MSSNYNLGWFGYRGADPKLIDTARETAKRINNSGAENVDAVSGPAPKPQREYSLSDILAGFNKVSEHLEAVNRERIDMEAPLDTAEFHTVSRPQHVTEDLGGGAQPEIHDENETAVTLDEDTTAVQPDADEIEEMPNSGKADETPVNNDDNDETPDLSTENKHYGKNSLNQGNRNFNNIFKNGSKPGGPKFSKTPDFIGGSDDSKYSQEAERGDSRLNPDDNTAKNPANIPAGETAEPETPNSGNTGKTQHEPKQDGDETAAGNDAGISGEQAELNSNAGETDTGNNTGNGAANNTDTVIPQEILSSSVISSDKGLEINMFNDDGNGSLTVTHNGELTGIETNGNADVEIEYDDDENLSRMTINVSDNSVRADFNGGKLKSVTKENEADGSEETIIDMDDAAKYVTEEILPDDNP